MGINIKNLVSFYFKYVLELNAYCAWEKITKILLKYEKEKDSKNFANITKCK